MSGAQKNYRVSLTGPLLTAPPPHDADLAATDAELATIIELARNRGAQDIVIGSGRTPHAGATARAIEAAWDRVGGRTLDTITWPETAASWLRHASRFAASHPDLWVMVGPATGWAQMTRRLLWSTDWTPAHTLATAAIGDPRTLALVGLHNLDGLAGASADGTSWLVCGATGAISYHGRIGPRSA
jgi:sugar phosphate isomerase/epimerase